LKSVRDDLRAWLTTAGLPAPEREATLLACSEAVANAMEHGYGNDGRGLVEVRAVLYDDAVELTVLDRGTWREPDPRSDRGRGITLIGSLMEQVSVEHDGGTVVTMRRKRQPGGAP
jgi:serine/threonine-protein kinase RsbW